jgi:hypothetical protein
MAASLTVRKINRSASGGVEICCEDSRGVTESMEFGSRREARQQMQRLLDDEVVKDLLRAIVIARGLRATQDGDTVDDLDALVGKVITINLRAAQNIVRIV